MNGKAFIEQYMATSVWYGGVPIPRGDVIRDLDRLGIPQESRYWLDHPVTDAEMAAWEPETLALLRDAVLQG